MASSSRGGRSALTWAVAVGGALTIHSAAAIALYRVNATLTPTRDRPVEIEVHERLPPPEVRPEPPPPPLPPPPEPPRPRLVARRLAPREPPPPVPATPPPPNQEPPPDPPKEAPPVFGVTMSSVVTGDSPVAVPIGNTTMTKERSRATTAAPRPYAGEGTQPFQPVADVYIATRPHVLYEVNSADIYPPETRNLGIEGKVTLSVGLDAQGKVVQVKVLERAGHGFDEVAAKALWKFRFSPALTSDGRAVPYRLTYIYTFEIHN